MNGVTLLTMLTMVEVVGVTMAELVQAYSMWGADRQRSRGSSAVARNGRPPTVRQLPARTSLPVFPTVGLGVQKEG